MATTAAGDVWGATGGVELQRLTNRRG